MRKRPFDATVSLLEWIRAADLTNDKVELLYITKNMILLSKYCPVKKWTSLLQVSLSNFEEHVDNGLVNVYSNKKRKRFYATLKKEN